MQLSRHSDYTLRVLLYLAVRPGERATLALIAGYFDISLEHLRKIVHELGKIGYIRTYQGKGGGIELALEPARINIGTLLESLEGGKPLIDCAGLQCRLAPACTLNVVLGRAQQAFFATLSEYTLADLISNKAMARELTAER
jgi:Rrf2 family nitric oxide-sensitive transcriptional repressor